MRRTKIAQVITRLDWGGSSDIVRIICANLDKDEYDIQLIIGDTQYPRAATEEFLNRYKDSVTIVPQLKRNIAPLEDLWALASLYLIFKKEKFDIVHTHTAKAGFLGRLAAALAGTPVIIHTPHGHNFYGYFGKFMSAVIVFLERIMARFTDRIIAMTEIEKMDYVKYGVANPDKIDLIYVGLELKPAGGMTTAGKDALKKSLGAYSGEIIVAMVGRIEHIKGPHIFIEAAAIVSARLPNVKFIVVGEGGLRASLEKRVKAIGLNDRIIFTGWREDAQAVISVCDIIVMPSLNEAVGMSLIEAQSMAVSVIASNVGGIPEIVKDNETAILVKPNDYTVLADSIYYLVLDDDLRIRMGKAGKEWVKNRFSVESMIDKTASIYEKLSKDKSAVNVIYK